MDKTGDSEKSCGAVVYTKEGGEIKYLVIRSLRGVYGFPKGHMEAGESETETALREIFEEAGVRVSLIPGFRAEDSYTLPLKRDVTKQVVYFAGRYEGQTPEFQKEELSGVFLCSFEEAKKLIRFESSRRILCEADAFIRAYEAELERVRGEKNELLYIRQKELLEGFLQRGAISRAQYDKSMHDLAEKTGHAKG